MEVYIIIAARDGFKLFFPLCHKDFYTSQAAVAGNKPVFPIYTPQYKGLLQPVHFNSRGYFLQFVHAVFIMLRHNNVPVVQVDFPVILVFPYFRPGCGVHDIQNIKSHPLTPFPCCQVPKFLHILRHKGFIILGGSAAYTVACRCLVVERGILGLCGMSDFL